MLLSQRCNRSILLATSLACVTACGREKRHSADKQSSQDEPSLDVSAETAEPEVQEVAADAAYYIFIVPGFGYDIGEKLKKINPDVKNSFMFKMFNKISSSLFPQFLPADDTLLEWQQSMERYAALFNLPAGRVKIFTYSYASDTETIKQQINQQIRAALAVAPAGARYDIIGHSEGGFAGFYGAIDGPNAKRLRKFVSLAGVPLGWSPRGILGISCRTGTCGRAHLKIIPRRSRFINDFIARDAATIKQVTTCSLYALNDGFVEPANAGAFEKNLVKASTNQEVPGMTHLKVFEPEFFTKMQSICYPEGFNIEPDRN